MARAFVFAALFVTAAKNVTSNALDSSCSELDESSLLQKHITRAPLVAAGASEQRNSQATEVLASARSLADAVKENKDGVGSILFAAENHTNIVDREVIPSIQSAMANIVDLLAAQRSLVKQCDVDLQAGSKSKYELQHAFQEKRSEHKACLVAESSMAELVTGCLERRKAAQIECVQLEVSSAAKGVECDSLRAGVAAAACAQASDTRAVCESYRACRVKTMARYAAAAHAGGKKAQELRTQLLEAKQALCISQGLAISNGNAESIILQLERCDALTLDANDQTPDALPPAIACQDFAGHSCSNGLLELDVGSENETWSVPCSACPSRQQRLVSAPRRRRSLVASTPVSASTAEGSSAEATAVSSAEATAEASRSPRAHFASWISSAKDLAWILNPRHRSAATVSLIGVGAKSTTRAVGQLSTIDTSMVMLLVLPLVALVIALFVTVASGPQRNYGRASDGRLSPTGSISGSNLSTGQVYARGRGSLRPSLASPGKAGAPAPQPVAHSDGLCSELNVPAGNECILGIPSLAGAVPGGVMLENIIDSVGRPLLSVGLSSAPHDGDCIMLAKKGQQELAYCETGSAVRSEGWAAKIFRWNGELFAQLREASAEDQQRMAVGRPSGGSSPSSAISGAQMTYVILSAAGPPWELRVKGNFREWNLFVEDGHRQVMAMVSPGAERPLSKSASGGYRLRLGPRADSCTVILALLAIERILCKQGESPQLIPRSSSHRSG